MMKFTNNAPGAKALKVGGKPVIIRPGESRTADFDELDKDTLEALETEGCTFAKSKAKSAK